MECYNYGVLVETAFAVSIGMSLTGPGDYSSKRDWLIEISTILRKHGVIFHWEPGTA